MDTIIILLSCVLLLLGLFGAFLPVLLGPLLGFGGLAILQLRNPTPFSMSFVVIWLVITVGVTILDYYIPVIGTKKLGGTKRGTKGSIIGLLVSIFFVSIGPFGIVGIIGFPFIGALIGEILYKTIHQYSRVKPLKSALGSFIGFLAGTILKLAVVIVMGWYVIDSIFS